MSKAGLILIILFLLIPVFSSAVFRTHPFLSWENEFYNPALVNELEYRFAVNAFFMPSSYKSQDQDFRDYPLSVLGKVKVDRMNVGVQYARMFEYDNFKRELNIIQLLLGSKFTSVLEYGIAFNYLSGRFDYFSYIEEARAVSIDGGLQVMLSPFLFLLSYKKGYQLDKDIFPNEIRSEWISGIVYQLKSIYFNLSFHYTSPEYYRSLESGKVNKEVIQEDICITIGYKWELDYMQFFQNIYRAKEEEAMNILSNGISFKVISSKNLELLSTLLYDLNLQGSQYYKAGAGITIQYGELSR